jgi:hypothetical protein
MLYCASRNSETEINETWTQARKIYEAAGFKEVVRFKGFFNPTGTAHEDGIVMRRSIPS